MSIKDQRLVKILNDQMVFCSIHGMLQPEMFMHVP